MDIPSTPTPSIDSCLPFLLGLCVVCLPFVLPLLLLLLLPYSENEGTPNEVLWEQYAAHFDGHYQKI